VALGLTFRSLRLASPYLFWAKAALSGEKFKKKYVAEGLYQTGTAKGNAESRKTGKTGKTRASYRDPCSHL
jgi:hypothetical protein